MADIYLREGSKIYQARHNVGGKIIRRSTGERCPKAAQKEADRFESEQNKLLLRDDDIFIEKSIDTLIKQRKERGKPYSPNTVRHYNTSLANVIEVLGNFPLRVLDEEKLNHYIKTKLRTGKTVQLRRDLAFLSALYTQARWWDCGVTVNPVRDINKKDIPDARKRKVHFHYHQFEKLLLACKTEEQKRFILLAVYTGMRHQEIMQLRWDEIDLDRGLIQLEGDRTKNSDPRSIPLHEAVLNTLSNTPDAHRAGYVFKGRKEGKPQFSFSKRWSGIRKRAGMPKMRIHDLRHTFASWLKQSDVAESTIMELMGHKTRSMTQRYSHDSLKSLKRAVGRIGENTL